MKKQLRNEKGFTLIELIMVIAILGILAAAALPIFADLTNDAKISKGKGIMGAVQSGVSIKYAQSVASGGTPAYPSLDGAANGSCTTANACFGNVLQYPVTDGSWTKVTGGYNYTASTPNLTCTYSTTGVSAGLFSCS